MSKYFICKSMSEFVYKCVKLQKGKRAKKILFVPKNSIRVFSCSLLGKKITSIDIFT